MRKAGGDWLRRRWHPDALKTNYLLLKNIEVSGLQISDYRRRRPAQVACYADSMLQPSETTSFPLERAGGALAALHDRRLAARAVLHVREAGTREAL